MGRTEICATRRQTTVNKADPTVSVSWKGTMYRLGRDGKPVGDQTVTFEMTEFWGEIRGWMDGPKLPKDPDGVTSPEPTLQLEFSDSEEVNRDRAKAWHADEQIRQEDGASSEEEMFEAHNLTAQDWPMWGAFHLWNHLERTYEMMDELNEALKSDDERAWDEAKAQMGDPNP